MHLPAASSSAPLDPSRLRRLLDFTIVRLVIALFATALAGGLTAQFVSDHTRGSSLHAGWPSLCGALAALAVYALYVRLVERRAVAELALPPLPAEAGLGLAAGAALVALVVGGLAAFGSYRFEALNPGASGLAAAFAQMLFVGVFEELLMRAVILRLLERSLGSWMALGISSLLFGLAHLPGNGAGGLSIVIAVVAGAMFGAAYLATRRLWLCLALHTGWNFTLGSVFSIVVSGHERSVGLIAGRLEGPTWLTGGAYGLEASVLTLVLLLGCTAWLLARAVSRGHVVAWAAREAKRRPSAGALPAAR